MQRYKVYFIWKLLYMFRVVRPTIIRSANNCMYSIWYLSHHYCYLPLAAGSSNGVMPPTAHSNQFQLFHAAEILGSNPTGGMDICLL
jgi:hypothetical protein